MVNQGDRVNLGDREAVVTSTWGQGKHRAYALDDGTTVLDLTEDQVVSRGNTTTTSTPPTVSRWPMTTREDFDEEEDETDLSD